MTQPFNRSLNKVRVTKLFGTDSYVGLINPDVNQKVRHGIDTRWIKTLDSGNFQVGLALTSGGPVIGKAYPHELQMDTPTASGWGWPATSHEPVGAGHSGVFPNGITIGLGSGMAYLGGDGVPKLFSRTKTD